MKQTLFLLFFYSFAVININAQIKPTIDYKCSFKGKNKDIIKFLAVENLDILSDLRMKNILIGYDYMFLKGDEIVQSYVYKKDRKLLTTTTIPISYRSEKDRDFTAKIFDLSDTHLKIIIIKNI